MREDIGKLIKDIYKIKLYNFSPEIDDFLNKILKLFHENIIVNKEALKSNIYPLKRNNPYGVTVECGIYTSIALDTHDYIIGKDAVYNYIKNGLVKYIEQIGDPKNAKV